MSELMDAIYNRRSIRHYKDTPVPAEALDAVLDAVRWAPSWANCQCWEVIVVDDAAVKEKLGETLAKGNPAKKSFAAAPLVLVLCAKLESSGYYKNVVTTKFGDWFMFDMGIACQNLCLAAHDQGLGTVITGLFDHDAAAKILEVPAGYELVTMVPLGYPEKGSSAPKRREISEFTHNNRF